MPPGGSVNSPTFGNGCRRKGTGPEWRTSGVHLRTIRGRQAPARTEGLPPRERVTKGRRANHLTRDARPVGSATIRAGRTASPD